MLTVVHSCISYVCVYHVQTVYIADTSLLDRLFFVKICAVIQLDLCRLETISSHDIYVIIHLTVLHFATINIYCILLRYILCCEFFTGPYTLFTSRP